MNDNLAALTILQSDYSKVELISRNSDILLITFDPWTNSDRNNLLPFGEKIAVEFNFDQLHVSTSINNWYADLSLDDFKLILDELRGRYKKIVAFGSSMGGFAVCNFIRHINIDASIVFSPQAFYGETNIELDARWAADWYKLPAFCISNTIAKSDDTAAGNIYIFYDPIGLDRMHAEIINQSCDNAILIPLSYSGHPVGYFIKEIGLLKSIIKKVVFGDFVVGEFISQRKEYKVKSPTYFFNLAVALRYKHFQTSKYCLRQAIRLSPLNAQYHRFFSGLYFAEGKVEHAFDSALKSYLLDKNRVEYKQNLINISIEYRAYNFARKILNEIPESEKKTKLLLKYKKFNIS